MGALGNSRVFYYQNRSQWVQLAFVLSPTAPAMAANSWKVQEKSASVEKLGQESQSVAYNRPSALHGCLTGRMQAPWRPPRSFPSGIHGTFVYSGCSGTCPTVCTRLKKFKATACIKMG